MKFRKLVFVSGVILAVAGTQDGQAMKRNLLSLENSKKQVDEYYKATFEALDELELRLAGENKVKDGVVNNWVKAEKEQREKKQKAHDAEMIFRHEQREKEQKEHDAKMRIKREELEKNKPTKINEKYLGSQLHVAVKNRDIEMVRSILRKVYGNKKQELVSTVDEDGRTPLHLAAMQGDVDIIDQLINAVTYSFKKDFIKIQDYDGRTALHLAAKHDCTPAAKALFEPLGYSSSDKKAFASIRDHNNQTTYDIAKELNLKGMIEFLKTYQ